MCVCVCAFNLNNSLWGVYNGSTLRAEIIHSVVCVNSHSTSTAIHMPAPLRPHCEPRHVTPRSALLNWNEGEQGCGKKPWIVTCGVCFSTLSSRNSLRAPFDSLNCVETVGKHHLSNSAASGDFFCKLEPDWLARMQGRLWLAESVLLTEGGLPESRGRWKRKKKKKFQLQNYTMRLPWVGLE